MTTTNAAILANLVRAAARQRQFMIPWIEDKRFVAEGGTLSYAVDTDIIVLYVAPEENAVAIPQRKEGYAQIFPNDKPYLSEALGRALAEFIFFHLGGDQPLLVIPPMEQEVRRVFAGVTRDAAREQHKAEEELLRLQNLASDLKKEEDQKTILDRLADEAPEFARLLAGRRGNAAKLRRFGHLLENTRVAPLEFALEKGWITDPMLCNVLAETESFSNRVRLRELREAWFERLSQEKSSATNTVLVYDDAQVLARLEWINDQLDNKWHKLLLITGDPSLHRAARCYNPEGRESCFADLYLRHPRAYLAEPHVLSPELDKTNKVEFLQWLDTFLAEVGTDDQEYPKRLDALLTRDEKELVKMATKVLRTSPEIVGKFQQNWESYTRNLLLVHGFRRSAAEDEDESLRKLTGDLQAVLNKVETLLKDRIRETWNACFVAATEAAGLLLLYQSDSNREMRPRNVPALCFSELERSEFCINQILSDRKSGWPKAAAFEKEVADLRKEDPSGYTVYLAYALLFAAVGNWYVAAILAERALDIALTDHPPHISGREAAYLKAVALRHTARNVTDLAEVEAFLKRAEHFLEESQREGRSLGVSSVRFKAERLALWLTYHLFRLFQNTRIPENIPSLSYVENKIKNLLAELGKEKKPLIAPNVERNLLTNLFMTAFLRWGKEQELLEPAALRSEFERYQINLDSQEKPIIDISFLVQAVYFTAAWWITTNDQEKENWRSKISDHLTDARIEENIVFPYDRRRFQFLRELVSR